jgi:cell division protease FtsH
MTSATLPGGSRRGKSTSRPGLIDLDAHQRTYDASSFDGDYLNTGEGQLGDVIPHPAAAAVAFIVRRAVECKLGLPDVLRRPGSVVVFEVPGPDWVEPVTEAWSQLVHADAAASEYAGEDVGQHPSSVTWCVLRRTGPTKAYAPSEGNNRLRLAVANGMSVCGISPDPARYLPSDLIHSVDIWITIPSLDDDAIAEAAFAASGERASTQIASDIARLVALDDLLLVRRPHQSANAYLERLDALTRLRHPAPRLTLDDVFGMEEAVTWGRSLAQDLTDFKSGHLPWSAVDRGLLLGGPAGTGKTTFAVALAASCQVPLVLGSLAQWQAAGHLGDLLKAMRVTFQQARQSSPCILFIDEIDAFGDRATLRGDNGGYSVQVVNALLEELDGAIAERE